MIVDLSDCRAVGDAGFGVSDVEHLAADEPDLEGDQKTAENIGDGEDERKESDYKDSVQDDRPAAAVDRDSSVASVVSSCMY